VIGGAGKPSQQFVNDDRRYKAGDWPTKKIPLFARGKSIGGGFETRPAGIPAPVPNPCTGCPCTGGARR
jgi:hypothetical protein